MKIIKKRHVLLGLLLILVTITCSFFFRMYRRDINTFESFKTAYHKSDKAMADFASSIFTTNLRTNPSANRNKISYLENKAIKANYELKVIALSRISSLIKNDTELRNTAIEIGDFSEKQLALLDKGKNMILKMDAATGQRAKLDSLSERFDDLGESRKQAYVFYKELSGINDDLK